MEPSKQSNTLDIKYLNLVRLIITKRHILPNFNFFSRVLLQTLDFNNLYQSYSIQDLNIIFRDI